MHRVSWSRRRNVGLLRRRPALDRTLDPSVAAAEVSKLDHVRALMNLVDRGLLSEEEFEQQESKVYDGR